MRAPALDLRSAPSCRNGEKSPERWCHTVSVMQYKDGMMRSHNFRHKSAAYLQKARADAYSLTKRAVLIQHQINSLRVG